LHDPCGRQGGQGRRLVLPGAAGGSRADQGPDRVLLAVDGQLVRGGRGIFVHPRDPYHRVDVLNTSRHIRISLDGELLAETDRAQALFESNLPTRWYIPREDVVATVEPTETVTSCPYKGTASYYSVKLSNGEVAKDVIWYYEDPLVNV